MGTEGQRFESSYPDFLHRKLSIFVLETLTYIRNFFVDKSVASITPSSKFVIRKICRAIDFNSAEVITEYGPATGVITTALLAEMKSRARLIAIERNAHFAQVLQKRLCDKRLSVINGSAEDARELLLEAGISSVDLVLSGIPFSFMPQEKREEIIRRTKEILAPNGKFIVYQSCLTIRSPEESLRQELQKYFSTIKVTYELRNIPPLIIIIASGVAPSSKI